jgi:hypothetical protein
VGMGLLRSEGRRTEEETREASLLLNIFFFLDIILFLR